MWSTSLTYHVVSMKPVGVPLDFGGLSDELVVAGAVGSGETPAGIIGLIADT